MSRDRTDAIIDRLDALLTETDDPEHRKEIREIQQLVIGVREDRTTGPGAGGGDSGQAEPADED